MKQLLIPILLFVTSFCVGQNTGIFPKATASGTDTYTVSITPSGISLADGQRYHIQFMNANTGAATLNVNSQGAKSIKKRSGEDLDAGDITSGQHHLLAYDGTNFQCLSCGGSTDGFVTVQQMMDSIESATQDFVDMDQVTSAIESATEDFVEIDQVMDSILNAIDTITSASVIYNGNSPSTVTVGGLPSGSSISGQTFESIIQAIVAPYVNPVFSAFSVSGQATTVEVGTTLSDSKNFTWNITENSGDVNVIDIVDVTGSTNLVSGTPNDGSQSVTVTTRQLNSNGATQQWRGVGYDANNSNATFNSSTFTVTARPYRFYGPASSDPANSAAVRALSGSAFQTSAGTFDMETGTTETNFYVAMPPDWVVSSAIDVDALNAPIIFNLVGNVTVNDAGSTGRTYKLYKATVGLAYSESHTYRITMALE